MNNSHKENKGPKEKNLTECDLCDHFACSQAKDCFDGRDETIKSYQADRPTLILARAAADVEAAHYGRATRLEEIVHFARAINARHVGVAFCTGFKTEARIYCDLMRRRFKVSSVCCKNCAVPKATFSMPHVRPVEKETMCNPKGQAERLNEAQTDLNVLIGLCVGHDSIFFKHSAAPVTVLIAKDRVLAHNPVGALYSPYIRRRLEEGIFAD